MFAINTCLLGSMDLPGVTIAGFFFGLWLSFLSSSVLGSTVNVSSARLRQRAGLYKESVLFIMSFRFAKRLWDLFHTTYFSQLAAW